MFDLDQTDVPLSAQYLISVMTVESVDRKAVACDPDQSHRANNRKNPAMRSENHFAPIAALDLDPIKVKLMHQESGEGWSLAYADSVEFEYRRFLYLVKKFPNEQAAPLFDVDVFWHYHILDTMKYAADCETVFGYFLHHFPYVGLRGEADLAAHHRVGERMRELYEQTYGDAYIRQDEPAYSDAGGTVAVAVRKRNAAFSVPARTTAFSVPTGKSSLSAPTAKYAFSVPTAAPGPGSADVDSAKVDAPGPAEAAMFYSVRPKISRAA